MSDVELQFDAFTISKGVLHGPGLCLIVKKIIDYKYEQIPRGYLRYMENIFTIDYDGNKLTYHAFQKHSSGLQEALNYCVPKLNGPKFGVFFISDGFLSGPNDLYLPVNSIRGGMGSNSEMHILYAGKKIQYRCTDYEGMSDDLIRAIHYCLTHK